LLAESSLQQPVREQTQTVGLTKQEKTLKRQAAGVRDHRLKMCAMRIETALPPPQRGAFPR
jgi:hypothetical protein